MYNNKYLKVALVTPKVTLGKPLENAKEIMLQKTKILECLFILNYQ